MSELRYWFQCPKCGLRIWTSHHDRWAMETVQPHCPTCGTSTRRFDDLGLARKKRTKPWWKFGYELVDSDGAVIEEANYSE